MDSLIIYIGVSVLLGYSLGNYVNRWRVARAEKNARIASASRDEAVEWRRQYEQGTFAEEVIVIDPTDPTVRQHFYKMCKEEPSMEALHNTSIPMDAEWRP